MLRRIASGGSALLLALGTPWAPAAAQTSGWDLAVVLSPTLPARVDVLAKQPGYLSIVVTYTGARLAQFEVRSRLGSSAGLSASASSVPRTATGPGTHLFTNATRALVDDPTLRLPPEWATLAQRGGVLPADRYRFCAAVYVDDRPVTAERCATTIVELPQPPQLLMPTDGAPVETASPVFVWTPVTQIDAATAVRYRLRVAELPAGRLPVEAMGSLAWHEAEIDRRTQYVYPASALPLKDGMSYVWQVTAYDADGAPFGAGGGRSLIQRFTYRDPAAAVALGEIEVVPGIAVIPSLRGTVVVGGDATRLVVSGQVPLRITLPGADARTVSAVLRELVISRGPGTPRVIGGGFDATLDWRLPGGAVIERIRLGAGAVVQTAGTLRVGGLSLRATGTLARGAPLLDARTGGQLPARIGNDTLAVLVRAARLLDAGAPPRVDADVEAFGAPTCRPARLDVGDSTIVADLECATRADTGRGPSVTELRGRLRVAGSKVTAADLVVALSLRMPFEPARGAVPLTGRFTAAAGLADFKLRLPAGDAVLRFGALRLRARSVAPPSVGWAREGGWRVRVGTTADVSVRALALLVPSVDSIVLTGNAVELPAIERDGTVFGVPSFAGGDVRVRPRAVRWPASRLAYDDAGAGWRGELSGVAGVAHVSACVQAVSVSASRGVLTTASVDWPLDTTRVRGACTVRKADGSIASIESVSGLFAGTFANDSTTWRGSASFVERVVVAAAAAPRDATPPDENANIPATLRMPGGTLALRDASGRPLVAVRRVSERTFAFTPLGGASLPFEVTGGLPGTARFTAITYDARSTRLAGGDVRVAFADADPRRAALLATLPADADSLVVRGDPTAPTATLHAVVRLFGRRLAAPVQLVVDELGVATTNVDVTLANAAVFELTAGGVLALRVSRVRGSANVPLAGGLVERDLLLDAELMAPGLTRSFVLRVLTGGEGPVAVVTGGSPRAVAGAGLVRLDSLHLGTLAWTSAAGFALRAVGEGVARAFVRGGAGLDVPLRGIELTERELRVAAARGVPAVTVPGGAAATAAIADGVNARVLSWSVPSWTTAWSQWATAVLPVLSADASLQFDRLSALRAEWFTARLKLRGDSTVCGTAIARPLARAVLHTQGGVQFRLTAVTPVLPACAQPSGGLSALVVASLVRPAHLRGNVDAWSLAAPLDADVAAGTLRGDQSIALDATAQMGALELQLGVGALSVRADSVRWSGTAVGRLLVPQAPPTPSGAGVVAYDIGTARMVSGRIEIAQSFAWRVPSGAGVLAAQVPRAVLDATGATLLGDGTVDGTDARITFDSLRLDADALRIIGGQARVQGTLPLALDAAGWRVAAAGLTTLPLVNPTLDATGLAAGAAGASSLNAAGVAIASLDTRLTPGFRFGVDPGSVTVGRADLHDSAAPDAPRRAWVDSLGLHVEGVVPALPDSIALPAFDIAYARLRVNGQLVPNGTVGNTLTVDASTVPLQVVFPALGGITVPMLGSVTVDGAGRVSGGSLSASLGATPLDLAASGLPLQLRAMAFGPVGGALTMRASVTARALPGLADFALPTGDLTLSAAGLRGVLASGSCGGNAAPVAERSYASGALTLRLLGYQADLTQRTLCARLDAVAQLGGAGSPATTIPVSATWNVGTGRWVMTAAAQELPEVNIGVAVLTPDAQQGITVLAQDPGTFALLMRGGVSFPQALGDGVAVAVDTLRIGTDGVRVMANSAAPQQVTLFSDLLTLRTSRIAADYTAGVLSLSIDGALSMLGRSDLALQGLTLRSSGTVQGGSVLFGQPIDLLAQRLSLTSLAVTAVGGRLGADLGGQLSLPAPFSRTAPFSVQVRAGAAGWTAEMQAPSIAFGTQLAIGDNADTEVQFGEVATFDLLNLGIVLDLRAPRNARITASAALYLLNDVGNAVVFGSPANAAAEPGLRIDRSGVAWNATLPAGLPSLDLGLFGYTLTGFRGVSAGGRFGFTFDGRASLNVPGVTGTMSLEGLTLGLDGAAPGSLGNGPHELSLMGGIASFRIGALARGNNATLTLRSAGQGANAVTNTVEVVEFVRLTQASMSLGMGFFEGSVGEVLIYRTRDGTRSLGVTDAALSLAGVTTLNASMRYVNGPDGYRLSAGGSAMIAGGSGFGAAGFFSNRGGTLGAGLFIAANANIPLLPPLISLSAIGGGLFINPMAEDVQMVLDAVEGMGLRLVGTPPTLPGPNETMGFAAYLYAGAGLIGAAGGYVIEGKALLQVTSNFVRIDARGVMLGQTDRLTAGAFLEVQYGSGWSVTGRGEADIDFPGVDGHASTDFMLASQNGRFTWAIQAQASLDVVAFHANGAFFASNDGFYAEVGIGSGFSYGPVDIGAEVVVGVFLDVSRPKFGAFGIVSAHVDLEVAEASATLKGALVVERSGVYLGFGGVGYARVGDWEVSGAVHASFDHGDFSAGLGRDKKLDRIIDDMRSTASSIESSATAAAATLRAQAEANWWRASERTLEGAGYALLNLSAADRDRILAPVLAAEALTVLPAAQDIGNFGGLSPSAFRQWVLDSVYGDPTRPRSELAANKQAAFEGAMAATGTISAGVLEQLRLRFEGSGAAPPSEDASGSPLTVTAAAGQPLRLSVDVAAYDGVASRARGTGGTDSSLVVATAVVEQAERALTTLDQTLGGSLLGGGSATLATAGELYVLAHDRLQDWQGERVALGYRAKAWGEARFTQIGGKYAGTLGRYTNGWQRATADGTDRIAQLVEAAVARRRALLQLAALSPTFAGEPTPDEAEVFRAQLLALNPSRATIVALMPAIGGTWDELWFQAPKRGFLAAGLSAVEDARALVPALAQQRDSLARRQQVMTDAVNEVYGGRLALTAQVAALFDEVRLIAGAPAAWGTRRDVLMQDLEPPVLAPIQVSTTTADGVATSRVSWSASHPNGVGGYDGAVNRDGNSVPQYLGSTAGLTVATVYESTLDLQRRYAIAVRARSRAGASVMRTATIDVRTPQAVQDAGSEATPVATPPDPAPAAPTVTLPYVQRVPIPLGGAGMGGLAGAATAGFDPSLIPGDFDRNVPLAGAPPPPPGDTRVYFWNDGSSIDVTVSGLPTRDLAAVEVAIGTTSGGAEVRAFAPAPSVVTGQGQRQILLRGLSLQRDIDYWIRVRARDAAGQLSGVAVAPRPLRIDDRPPAAPQLRAIEYRADGSALVRITQPEHAPSGRRKFEYAISSIGDAAMTFNLVTPVPWTADTVVVPAADRAPGRPTWLHIRSASYAEKRGPIRSIEVAPPVQIAIPAVPLGRPRLP